MILFPGHCKGFIRVVMNLSRPINVLPGTRPPSVLNLTQDASLYSEHQLTSFYLPLLVTVLRKRTYLKNMYEKR